MDSLVRSGEQGAYRKLLLSEKKRVLAEIEKIKETLMQLTFHSKTAGEVIFVNDFVYKNTIVSKKKYILTIANRKKAEILQMAVLEPKFALLDEIDSGLDIDALRDVAKGVNVLRSPERAIVLVTHYQRLLNYITPDFVHILSDGRIIKSGGRELALEVERDGYTQLRRDAAPA